MQSIEIIRLRQEHIEDLIEFFIEINSPEYTRNFSPHPFDEEHARFICGYQGSDLYYSVVLDGEKIIGYCMLRGWDEGYEIPSIGICLLKEYRSLGLARTLMHFLETVSRLNGCSKVMLKVRKENKAARSLFEKNGYIFNEYSKEFLIGRKDLKD